MASAKQKKMHHNVVQTFLDCADSDFALIVVLGQEKYVGNWVDKLITQSNGIINPSGANLLKDDLIKHLKAHVQYA